MKIKTIFVVVLALLMGFGTLAQADELSVLQIVNKLLDLQNINLTLTQAQLDATAVSYETFAPGTYDIVGYGKQAGNNQAAFAYSPSGAFTDISVYSNANNSPGELISPKVSFITPGEWGLKGVTSGGTFLSESAKNTDNTGGSVHWKLYCLLNKYNLDIGFAAYEDLPYNNWGGGEPDYNDFVLKIEPNPPAVPLPGAILLLGAGMARLVAYARRRREE